MKTNRSKSLFLGLLLPFCLIFSGVKTYAADLKIYVSVSGKDSNPGTKDFPLASLNEAVNKLRSIKKNSGVNGAVEVIIGEGNYFVTEPLVLDPDDSGTADSPVVFRAEEGTHPVFCGGKAIVGFEKISETLWRAKVPEVAEYGWRFEQLYINGKRAVRAKSPNTGFYHLKNTSDSILQKGGEKTPELAIQRFTLFPDGAGEVAKYSKEDFENGVITFYHNWDNTRNRIYSFDQNTSTAFVVGAAAQSYNRIDTKSRYTLENFRAALDTCGEWFLERSGYLYYMPLPEETIDNLNVIAPVTDRFVTIRGNEKMGKKVENIRFENLSFQFTGYKMPFAGIPQAQAAFPIEAVIMADFAQKIQFVNCEIAHVGTNAFWFRNGCNDCSIEHCYLHDLGAGGVKIGDLSIPKNLDNLTRNVVVDNNIIKVWRICFPVRRWSDFVQCQ